MLPSGGQARQPPHKPADLFVAGWRKRGVPRVLSCEVSRTNPPASALGAAPGARALPRRAPAPSAAVSARTARASTKPRRAPPVHARLPRNSVFADAEDTAETAGEETSTPSAPVFVFANAFFKTQKRNTSLAPAAADHSASATNASRAAGRTRRVGAGTHGGRYSRSARDGRRRDASRASRGWGSRGKSGGAGRDVQGERSDTCLV